MQQLERRQFDDTNNSASLQTELVRIADWMQKNNGASEQVADVLGALQREQDDHRQGLPVASHTQSTSSLIVVCAFAARSWGRPVFFFYMREQSCV